MRKALPAILLTLALATLAYAGSKQIYVSMVTWGDQVKAEYSTAGGGISVDFYRGSQSGLKIDVETTFNPQLMVGANGTLGIVSETANTGVDIAILASETRFNAVDPLRISYSQAILHLGEGGFNTIGVQGHMAYAPNSNDDTYDFGSYDGGTTLYRPRTVWIGTSLYTPRGVEDHVADNTLTEGETFKVNTNLGDAGVQVQTLPAAAKVGTTYTFFVAAAFELRVDPNTADKIVDADMTGLVDAEYITSSTLGSSITLVALSDGDWAVINKTGTWAEETP